MSRENTKSNLLLENSFEEVFNKIFTISSEDEKYFLTIHKYCLRKKYVSHNRKNIQINLLNKILYSSFRKFDGYYFLTLKIFLNIFTYFFLLPFISWKKLSFKGKLNLVEAHSLNKKEFKDNSFFYPGSIHGFIRHRKKINNFFSVKHILRGIRKAKFPSFKFLILVSSSFSRGPKDGFFCLSTLTFYFLYSFCKGMLNKEHDQIKFHFTYGAVIAPQKIFALHFLSNKYESQVISHGSFHCVQCSYQPATKFNSFGLQKDNINMGSSDYFYLNKIKNPFRPIKYSFRKEYNTCLTDVLQELDITKNANTKILVFSSAYDCGIARDPYFGIFRIIACLKKYQLSNIEIKLHPSESTFFFKILFLILFKQFPNIIHSINNVVYDVAIGMPSTLITELDSKKKVLIYSIVEYNQYDVVYKDNVKYFGRIL